MDLGNWELTAIGSGLKFEIPPGQLASLGFVYVTEPVLGMTMLVAPFWFLVLVSGSLAMIFRMRWPWRFNLRSLFMAMTFLTVVLGMSVWLDHSWIGKQSKPPQRPAIFGQPLASPTR